MNIIREITSKEMLQRFAIGEVFSNFFHTPNNEYRKETYKLLESGEQSQVNEGIKRVLCGREPLVQSLPKEAKWYLAKLPINLDYFSAIQTINDSGWVSHSGGTHKLIDAAINLRDAPGTDIRVDSIVSAFKQGNIEMRGITLMGQSEKGPYTIAEGNGRLVAVYLCCIDEQSSPICKSEIEVVLGTTEVRWNFR